ncbi:MAG TPA: ABC transporter permease [Verrucomicrobiae bacterium]|nr:ABC transporter permease [Verrucomicrobiae bacterium]
MRLRLDLLTIYGMAFLVFLYAPVLLLPLFSFNDNTFAVFPLRGFTLQAYVDLAHNDSLLNALRSSLMVAGSVSVFSTIFGLLGAMAVTRYRLPGRGPIMGVIMLPLVVPSIILAVALLIVVRQAFDLPLTLFTVGAGHILLCVPFSMLVLISRLEGFDKSLEEAANDLGENGWMTFWRVTFPLALPGIVSSLLMAFTVSFDEYVIAFFLSGINQTLPIFLYSQLRFPDRLPMTEALGSCILFASTIIVVASELLRRSGVKSARPTGL